MREATERSLGDFLENPQNLLMLLRAVRTGQWPATRKELFGLSTHVMLQEFNPDRALAGSGTFTADKLRPAAGAVCAVRLISDIEAISLADHETSTSIPSYRTLVLAPPEKGDCGARPPHLRGGLGSRERRLRAPHNGRIPGCGMARCGGTERHCRLGGFRR